MPLSELALQRRNSIELWVKDQLNWEFYAILARYEGNNRGAIAYKRLMMMAGQVQIPDINGTHILDDDENWKIFEREMKIPIGIFYNNVEPAPSYTSDESTEILPSWFAILYSHAESMERNFWQTKFDFNEDGTIIYRPERTARIKEWNDFAAYNPYYVYQKLNITSGHTQLSNDRSLKSLVLVENNTDRFPISNIVEGQTHYTHSHFGGNSLFTLEVEPTSELAHIDAIPTKAFIQGQNLGFLFKIHAEDGTTTEYSFTIIDGNN